MAPRAEVPRARDFKRLRCQTWLIAHIDAKRVSGALANQPVRSPDLAVARIRFGQASYAGFALRRSKAARERIDRPYLLSGPLVVAAGRRHALARSRRPHRSWASPEG
jgi:hypothetical protein